MYVGRLLSSELFYVAANQVIVTLSELIIECGIEKEVITAVGPGYGYEVRMKSGG